MSYETVLLIGGQRDGERMSVLAGVQQLEIASPSERPSRIENFDTATTASVKYELYRREPVHSSKGFRGAVYVIDNGVDALPALVEGYRGGRKSFEAMAGTRGYNIEQHEGCYVSKLTAELYEFWRGGRK